MGGWLVPRRYVRHLLEFLLRPSELRPFLRSCRQPPRRSIRLNGLRPFEEFQLKEELSLVEAVKWCDSGWFCSVPGIGRSRPHFLGQIYSQEAASMLPAEVLKSFLPTAPLVLDLCAAPGGKAIQLCEALSNLGGLLVANDCNGERLQRLRSNLLRCGALCVTSELPGEAFASCKEVFDAVLVDAPCSAEGNVRRDRSVLERWRRGTECSKGLLERQKSLLESAYATLKPGGYMVYSTCTLNYFENEQQCLSFAENVDVEVVDLSSKFGAISAGRFLRLWPQSFDTEGFFVAAFRKPGRRQAGRLMPHGRLRRLDWRHLRRLKKQLGVVDHIVEDNGLRLVPLAALREELRPLWRMDKVQLGLPLWRGEGRSCELQMFLGPKDVARAAALELELCDSKASRNAQLAILAAKKELFSVAYNAMQSSRLQPDAATYSALVAALARGHEASLAHELCCKARLRRESFNQVLHGFALSRDHESVRKVMSTMATRDLKPDVVSYNTLLKALQVDAHWNEFAFLEEMSSVSVAANNITYTSLMSRAARARDVDTVDRLMQSAERKDVKLGAYGFNILLEAHVGRSDLVALREVVAKMRDLAVSPDVVTYTTLKKAVKWVRKRRAEKTEVWSAAAQLGARRGEGHFSWHVPKTYVISCYAHASGC